MENIINKMLERINFKIQYAHENFVEWNTFHERRMAEIDGMIDMLAIVTGYYGKWFEGEMIMLISKYFNMGKMVVTRGIYEAMKENDRFAAEVNLSLQRYAVKDWGNLDDEDKQANEEALKYPDDLYLLAAYQTCRGKIYIITNMISEKAGDNSTIVCFPDER